MSENENRLHDRKNIWVQHKCTDCGLRTDKFFCNLSAADRKAIESIKSTKVYEKGTTLFNAGQPATGIFMLCQGRVKLSVCSSDGRVLILGVAAAGEVLGLSAVISGVDHEVTAEAMEISQINYVPADAFNSILRRNPEICLSAVRQLGSNSISAHRTICSLGLSDSVFSRLGKLILSWSGRSHPATGPAKIEISFTHEEIAGMLGTTRETVTRSLGRMRERGLISLRGSEMTIHDQDYLRLSVGDQN